MSVYYPSISVNFTGNTTGTTASQFTGNLYFAGGPNITLSNSTNSLGQTISFSGGAGGGGGSYFGGISTGGNTSGTSGTNSIGAVFVGGNNMTLSQATGAGGNTITFSSPNMFSAGISNIGNTSGTSGVFSNRVVLAGGNNITLSQNTNSAGATVTISAFNQSAETGISGISASGGIATSGTVSFANSNNFLFGMNGQTITLSKPNISYWENIKANNFVNGAIVQANLSLQRIRIDDNLIATELNFIGHMTGSSAAASGAISGSFGIYALSASTLSLLSSATAVSSWTSGSAITDSQQWGGQSGTRYRTAPTGTWNITPGDYMLGAMFSTATSQTAHTWTVACGSSVSLVNEPGVGNMTRFWGNGILAVGTGGLPNSVHITNFNQTGALVLRQPWIRLIGTF